MSRFRSRAAVAAASGLFAAGVAGLTLAGPAGAVAPACGNAALSVSHSSIDSATGHSRIVLLFKNVSASTCTIYGYPGLDALDHAGHALAHAQRTLSGFMGGVHTEATAVIPAGHYASATAEWMNFNPVTSGPCTYSSSIAYTPANTTLTVHSPVSVSVCQLQIHPTVPGTSGNDGYAQAKGEWIDGSGAISSQQGTFWSAAASDLNADGATYATQVAQLKQLISLPDANQTPTQNAEYHSDITALNTFFATPTLYS